MAKQRHLFSQLMLLGSTATAIAILLFGIYVAHVQRNLEIRALESEVQLVADDVGNAAIHYLIIKDYWNLEQLLKQSSVNPGIMLLQITSADGRVMGQIQRSTVGGEAVMNYKPQKLSIPTGTEAVTHTDQDRVDAWRPIQADELMGWVHVEHDLSESRLLQSHLWQDSLLIGLLVVPVSALLLFLLLRRPMGLLRHAAEFATQLPTSQGKQLEDTSSTQEIDTLIQALNTASRHLQDQDTALEQSRQQQERRSSIYEAMALGASASHILNMIIQGLEQDLPGTIATIMVKDKSGKNLVNAAAPSMPDFYCQAIEGLPIRDGVGSCGTAAFRGQRVIVEDIQDHPYWKDFRDLAGRANLRSCWSEPVTDSDGKVLGTLALYHHTPAKPNNGELELLHQTANLVTVMLRRQRNEEALTLADSVYQGSGEAITVTDEQNLIIAVNPAFTRVTGYSLDDVIGKNPSLLSSGRMGAGFYRAMWKSLAATGQWQGEIWNKRKNGEVYAEWLTINAIRDEEGNAYRHVAIFSDISEKKHAEETIWQQANYDQLTELPNRRLFRDRLEQQLRRAERDGEMLALLFVDLDRFKNVNDAMGHDAGDELLILAAQRLQECVRESDTVARLGSDEFALALTQVTDPGGVERTAEHILQRLSDPYLLSAGPAYLSASIGITLFPSDGSDAEALLLNAARAMNAAKHTSANAYSWYTLELQLAAKVRNELGNDLRLAVQENQFQVHYQPIVDLRSGRIVKAEALIRWQHPKQGLISPVTFIPLAEDLGMISEVGNWVFRTVVQQAKAWRDRGIDLQFSVNKSPRQFGANDDADEWLQFLEETGLPPDRLVVEITEGLLLDAKDEIMEQLDKLRRAGIQIAIDDFGTGYSALSYLQQFHIDYLKIDRSFIKDLGENAADAALADAIVVMAHKLGIQVIAEGVETTLQRDWLINASCDYVQGYFYAKPLPPVEFERLVKGSPV
ncbi:MAG TPA: EAL domain-containing protein [Rhodocyclaceae bacterium]|jgi:diguanylate cyclase (GGDEF)-like protein/PAS domain S-box-containing protein